MTDPSQVPIVPGGPAPTLGQMLPQPPKPKRAVWPVLVVAAALVVALCTTAVVLIARDTGGGTPAAGDPAARTVAPVVEAPPARVWPQPLAANIKLSVKTLKKECFGTAGCLITYTVEAEYTGPALEPGKVWDVTYEVVGAKDPVINTLQLEGTGDGYSYRTEREELTQTPRSSSVLSAKVTAVSAR